MSVGVVCSTHTYGTYMQTIMKLVFLFFLERGMCRIYIRGTETGRCDAQGRLESKSIRGAAEGYNINYSTLGRYCRKMSPEEIEGDPSIPASRIREEQDRNASSILGH